MGSDGLNVTMHVRGREYRGDSLDQWNKASILVMGEGNYSDAERQLGEKKRTVRSCHDCLRTQIHTDDWASVIKV